MSDVEKPEQTEVSRRNLFGGIALAILAPAPLSAAQVANKLAVLDQVTLHNLLRGLVLLEGFGDPVIDDDAEALLEQITQHIPHAPLLIELYRFHRRSGADIPFRAEHDGVLDVLHHAVAHAQPVSFDYVDLDENETRRNVHPLALVHFQHGIQLFAWCNLRDDYRRFFVREMSSVERQKGTFALRSVELLQGLLASEGITV